MSIEKSFGITLKLAMTESGSFESIRILKGRSQLPEDILEKLNKVLQESLIPSQPVKTTVAIGDHAEQKVFNRLMSISKVNMDFDVLDTSSQTGHGDISIAHQNKRICVEVKSYSKPVPMKEIEKYHRSLNLSEYDAGIMIQSDKCGYAREANIRSPIDIRIIDNKPTAYLTAIDDELLYPIIAMLIMNIDLESSPDQDELEKKRKALLSIHEKVIDLRSCIDAQKKTISKMEASVESIAKLSIS